MGKANKPKVEWLGEQGHGFVRVNDKVSTRSICGVDRDVPVDRKFRTRERCPSCKSMLIHKVQIGFVPERIKRRG